MRSEDTDRVTGAIRFVVDRGQPGMLHAAGVRSTHAHARIVDVDVSAALDCPGVVAVLTGEDVPTKAASGIRFGDAVSDQPLLAWEVTRYAGELVALVVAGSRQQARLAARHVAVQYEPVPFVVDGFEAIQPGAPRVHEDHPDNVCGAWDLNIGSIEDGWTGSERIYEDEYYSPPASHVPLEPHVALARWSDDGLWVDTSTQAPWLVASVLAVTFDLALEQVRVASGNVGGAFGSKVDATIEPVTAFAAKVTGAPVRYELTREEVFYTVGKHAAHVRIRTGVTNDGIISAREVSVVWNAGAYATSTPDAAGSGMIRSAGPYRIPNLKLRSVAAYTNSVPSGPFRGAMTSQLTWAYESQLDDIAADLGLTSLEIRRRNVLVDGDVYLDGKPVHDMQYLEMLDQLEEASRSFERSDSAAGVVRGIGVALMIKTTLTPSRSEARVVLHPDGTVDLYTSAVEMGQGASRALKSIVARELEVEPADVRLACPDTERTPFDSMSASSRTTFSVGTAITDACEKIRANQTGEPQTERLEATGVYQSRGGLRALYDPQLGDVTAHWHQGGIVVEVSVDVATGKIEMTRCHAVCFAGKVISPIDVQRQIEGCVIFGLGPALFEELVYEDGRITNPNFAGYLIPSMSEVPRQLSTDAIEAEGSEIHGIAEMNVPVVAPAIGNAIKNAIGHRFKSLPIRAEDVFVALHGNDPAGGGVNTDG